jgi:hypothetical protein
VDGITGKWQREEGKSYQVQQEEQAYKVIKEEQDPTDERGVGKIIHIVASGEVKVRWEKEGGGEVGDSRNSSWERQDSQADLLNVHLVSLRGQDHFHDIRWDGIASSLPIVVHHLDLQHLILFSRSQHKPGQLHEESDP